MVKVRKGKGKSIKVGCLDCGMSGLQDQNRTKPLVREALGEKTGVSEMQSEESLQVKSGLRAMV